MASSSSPPQQEDSFSGASSSDRPAFSGIEPHLKRRKVSESSRLYDVFINHRGPDVKTTLALELYKSLEKVNIRAFLDSEEKELGVSFTSTIEKAIRSAAVHIAIFSKGYAESPWCLEELVLMLRSKAKIIPIFYDVKPSALRYVEKGVYGSAFNEYENKKRYMEKLEEWKKALQSVSFIAGEELHYKSFSDCESIISTVQKEVQRMRQLVVAKYPVGLARLVEQFQNQCINEVVQEFESQCGMDKQVEGKSKIVGIFGMGGVGKTTLSKELFNRKRSDYNRSCFLFDVREASASCNLPSLQFKLLRELFDVKDPESFTTIDDGKSRLISHVQGSGKLSFLIVVDDIDNLDQLDALLIDDMLDKFLNSLIIVTTRDEGVLKSAGIAVRYHLRGLDIDNAKELFCWHAFRQACPSSGWEKLVDLFVEVCGGLPLSLQVLGSHVYGEDRRFWELELKKVKKTLPQDILKRLRISIATLDDEEKQIFMDVACFFIGEMTTDALSVWEASGWSSQHALRRLKNKCLLEEIEFYRYRGTVEEIEFYRYRGAVDSFFYDSEESATVLRMHDHLRDLGRQMAEKLGHPRRLWRSQVPLQYLELKAFKEILTQPSVRCLLSILNGNTSIKCFVGESKNMAETSTVLLWHEMRGFGDTLTIIPPWIPLQNLHSLRINRGSLETYWHNDEQAPFNLERYWHNDEQAPFNLERYWHNDEQAPFNLERYWHNDEQAPFNLERYWHNDEQAPFNLKELQILYAYELEYLSLTSLTCLEKISIHKCPNLSGVTAISDVRELIELNISRCQKIKELNFVRLSCLEKIRIFDCSNLKSLTRMSGLEKLVELQVGKCPKLEEISFVQLNCLEKVRIYDYPHLKSLAGISNLRKLVELQIENCPKLEEISFFQLNCVEIIRISDCPHLKSVAGISGLRKLAELQIKETPKLEEISFVQLNCLEKVIIYDYPHPKSLAGISNLRKLVELQIENCPKLEEISFFQLNCVEIIRISDCPHLKSVAGMSGLKELVEMCVDICEELEEISFFQLNCLERIRIYDCSHLMSVTGMSDLRKLVEFKIEFCPKLSLEEISFAQLNFLETISLVGCPVVKSIEVKCCKKLKEIAIPKKLIKLTLQSCPELQRVDKYRTTEVEELFISKCPELKLPEFSFRGMTLIKMQKITGFEKFHSLERMQLFYCKNEIVRKCILNMEKLPADFIQLIGGAKDGVESNFNVSFFCDEQISPKSVIQIGTDHGCPDESASAIILCAVVVVKTSTAADMINGFIQGCDHNPWLKFEVRQGELLIASVITNPDEIHRYILNKGYYFPFDYVFIDQAVTEDVMVRKGYKVTVPFTQGGAEGHKGLTTLRRIVDKLF